MKIPKIEHNQNAVQAYVEFLTNQDKKAKTIENKLFAIAPFLLEIGEKDVDCVTKPDLDSYALKLKTGKLVDTDGKPKPKLSPGTVHNYLFALKQFLNWKVPGNGFFGDIKIKKYKTDHSRDEYPDIGDVKKVLAVCNDQRDRAFVFALWESAGRLEEVLNLDVADVKPESVGVTVQLRGKTGVREVLLIDAVPDIMSWLQLHKGERGTPLFPTTDGGRLTDAGAQSIMERLAEKAGISGKKHSPHAYRHGRLTELGNLGMSEAQLRLFAGWTADSDMPSVYIHTKKKDVFRQLKRIKGIVPVEDVTTTVETTPIRCSSCGTDNPFDAIACYKCRLIFDKTMAVEIANAENLRRREIETLKKEIEKLKDARSARDKQESKWDDIIAGEISVLNRGDNWETLNGEHRANLADPGYRQAYNKYFKIAIRETFGYDDFKNDSEVKAEITARRAESLVIESKVKTLFDKL